MKRSLAIACVLVMGSVASAQYRNDVYVGGYFTHDGRYVQAHHRTSPNDRVSDNWSTYPNVNPYTGQVGTRHVFDSPPTGGITIDYTPDAAAAQLAAASAAQRSYGGGGGYARPVIFVEGGSGGFVSPLTHPGLYQPPPGIVLNTPQHVRVARKAAEREAARKWAEREASKQRQRELSASLYE